MEIVGIVLLVLAAVGALVLAHIRGKQVKALAGALAQFEEAFTQMGLTQVQNLQRQSNS